MNGKRFTINMIPGEYDSRVFIGGNYDSMPVLREISRFVDECGFIPVMAYDCEMLQSRVHDETMLLLHNCRFAIFEVTRPSGELMELERIKDYGNVALLVYQVKSSEEMLTIPGQISQMLTTTPVVRIGYHDFPTLKKHIQRFLMPQLLVGSTFPFVAIKAILGRDASPEETRIYAEALEARQLTEYQLVSVLLLGQEYAGLPEDQKTNRAYITRLYQHLLGREPREEEFALALNNLENHLTTKQQLLIDFIQLDEVCERLEEGIRQTKTT